MTKETVRVLELLKRFNDGQKVSIHNLKNEPLWMDMSDKTIRRDLDVIKQSFPDSFHLVKGEKGCYKAITNDLFNNLVNNPRNISLLVQTFNIAQRSDMFKSFEISNEDKSLLEDKIKQSKKLYGFKNDAIETKKNTFEIYQLLEHSIHYNKQIIIDYDNKGKIEKYVINPYKILLMHENFHLASEVLEQAFIFSPFRIINIKHIEETKISFRKNAELENFIDTMETPFAKYQKDFRKYLIKIVVEINKSKASYFTYKNYFKSQKILETKENGNLVISYEMTQFMEIESFIKSWLPFMKVIEPIELKDKIERELREYLDAK